MGLVSKAHAPELFGDDHAEEAPLAQKAPRAARSVSPKGGKALANGRIAARPITDAKPWPSPFA
jgi:hypothetical protein